jgi:hypothetical protein
MASTIISEEKSKEINSLTYLYKCTKCGIEKPNTDFVKSPNKRVVDGKGRAFTTSCKSCRNKYNKQLSLNPTEKFILGRIEQRKKHKLNSVFLTSRGNAKKRGLEHNITKQDIEELFKHQKGLCYYTNKPMYKDIRGLSDNNDGISIDRIDSSKGYIKDNIVLCRWIINRMKNDIDFKTFKEEVKNINDKFNI